MRIDGPTFTPHQIMGALKTGALLIDLRPHEQFASGHIPGSISVVFSRKSLSQRIATAIPPGPPIILFADDAGIAEAAHDALYGVQRNPLLGLATTGIAPWHGTGLPLATLPRISVAVLQQHLTAPDTTLSLIDVREPFEWELGYINGSLLIPLGEIRHRIASLDPGNQIVLICQEGLRSATAASILLHHHFSRVSHVAGGLGSWLDADYPTVRPPREC